MSLSIIGRLMKTPVVLNQLRTIKPITKLYIQRPRLLVNITENKIDKKYFSTTRNLNQDDQQPSPAEASLIK